MATMWLAITCDTYTLHDRRKKGTCKSLFLQQQEEEIRMTADRVVDSEGKEKEGEDYVYGILIAA